MLCYIKKFRLGIFSLILIITCAYQLDTTLVVKTLIFSFH